MREQVSIVTRKGQVTIPAEVRRHLGLEVGTRVAFLIEEGEKEARIVPRASVTERTAGAFWTGKPPLTAEQLREAAEIAMAEDAQTRGQA